MIQVQNVTKSYRSGAGMVDVLRGVDCTFEPGSFSFILGPSGSGKSTLLYLLGALDQPTAGDILIDGTRLSSLSARQRDRFRRNDVGFIFQSFNLLKNLDALSNSLLPYLATGCPPEIRQQGKDLLEQIGLGHRLDHRPAQLSGGEQQRVAIARAILKKPKLILADEPTGELDSQTGNAVFSLLRQMHEEHGVTVVVVTHDERYPHSSDRVLRISDGRIAPGSGSA